MKPDLRAFALAGLAALLPAETTDAPEAHFLLQARHRAAPNGDWVAALRPYLRRLATLDGSYAQLQAHLGLTLLELLAVALASAVEEDSMTGRAIAFLQAPLGGSRPTLGLLAAAYGSALEDILHPIEILTNGPAMRSGLLAFVSQNAPMPERAALVPIPLCHALRGSDGFWPGATLGMDDAPDLPLPEAIRAEAARQAAGLSGARRQPLVLRAGSRLEGRHAANLIAQRLKLRPLFIETEELSGLEPWLLLRGLLPVFLLDLAPSERKMLPALPFHAGPMLAVCGREGQIETADGATLSWTLPLPTRDEREILWQTALNPLSEHAPSESRLEVDKTARYLAENHRHGCGRIAVLGRMATHYAGMDCRDRVNSEDIAAVLRSGEGTGLESLAQPLPEDIPEQALVLTPTLRDDLKRLFLRCRARDGLAEGLGIAATARYSPGVRALFVGPSGTGKTLAAGWLATQLGLPLYRVDLASITSKYIGETEKNLAQLLSRAEQSEVVLLFDEADSLFGKRTEVKEANDRFANAQTNYLLQRIETFDGITLLTSNSLSRFDAAFARRLDMILEFPLPGPQERRLLWLAHLGEGHTLTEAHINRLAVSADLGGAHIRNTVLTGALLARDGKRPIAFADVVQGLQAEYRKLMRQMPPELNV